MRVFGVYGAPSPRPSPGQATNLRNLASGSCRTACLKSDFSRLRQLALAPQIGELAKLSPRRGSRALGLLALAPTAGTESSRSPRADHPGRDRELSVSSRWPPRQGPRALGLLALAPTAGTESSRSPRAGPPGRDRELSVSSRWPPRQGPRALGLLALAPPAGTDSFRSSVVPCLSAQDCQHREPFGLPSSNIGARVDIGARVASRSVPRARSSGYCMPRWIAWDPWGPLCWQNYRVPHGDRVHTVVTPLLTHREAEGVPGHATS
jgi:hypothetical protein